MGSLQAVTTPRRSRMVRTRTGKRLALTERDIDLFRWLTRYRYLRSTYLHASVGGQSINRFKERLGDLFHEGFLDRPERQWEFADARCLPAVHEISEGGRRALPEHGEADQGLRTYLSAAAHRQFGHSVLICACLASIELAARAQSDIRFIPYSEILARMPQATRDSPMPFRLPNSHRVIVPDGLFGLEYQADGKRTYRFFAFEVDRGTMPIERRSNGQSSYLGKLAAYRHALEAQAYRHHWGMPSLLVLTVMTDQQRLAETLRRLADQPGDNRAFLFMAMAPRALASPQPTLLHEPWQRAGHPPLLIDR